MFLVLSSRHLRGKGMRTIFEPSACAEVIERFDRLSPESPSNWGRMDAPRMVCHVADALRQALGEINANLVKSPLAVFPFNWLLIHVLPWPKGKARSPSEFLERKPATWEADVAECKRLIRAAHSRGADADWPISPTFGRISGRSFGVLVYKHLDHHLRQFGV